MRNEIRLSDSVSDSAFHTPHSALLGWLALVSLTFRRHWRVRALGWVTAGLLVILAVAVGLVTHVRNGWSLADRRARVTMPTGPDDVVIMTYRQYAVERLGYYQMVPGPPLSFGLRAAGFAPFQAVLFDTEYQANYAFLSFSRWVVFGLYLGFLLPLVNLAFASGAVGADREGRTLVWLLTRPLPRWAIYLAKFVGVLPWCVLVSVAGFAVLCAAGGELGRRAFATYWPAVGVGAVGFAALFQLVGAVFRRPAVLGLVYIFFFETLVANLPGSLKQLSLNYYVRSLMYNEASSAVRDVMADALDVYAPADPTTSWLTLALAAAALTGLGMWLFSRAEPKDET
jgi:ABC-type transport system involved in multi-copper enzyme maturation permease subunit